MAASASWLKSDHDATRIGHPELTREVQERESQTSPEVQADAADAVM